MRFFFLAILTIFLLSACSLNRSSNSPSRDQLQIEVDQASRLSMDIELAKKSQLFHHFLMGQLSYVGEDFDSALNHFERAESLLDVSEPLLHKRIAELYLRSGELEKALDECDRILSKTPKDPEAFLMKAGILSALDRIEQAEKVYLTLKDLFPDRFEIYFQLVSLYLKSKQYEKGIMALDDYLTLHPNDVMAVYLKGRIYEANNEFKLASEAYQYATDLSINKLDFKNDLLRVLLKLRDLNKVRAVSEDVIKLDPENIIARKILSELWIENSNFEEALKHLEVLASMDEEAIEARLKIALIYIEEKKFSEAARELQLVLASNPDNAKARYYLGSLYAGSGRNKEAIDELMQIQKRDELYIKSRTFAAFILRQDGDNEGAEKAVRDALEINKEDPQLLSYLILILRDSKKFNDAKTLLEASLANNPNDEKILFNYALVLHDLQDEEGAIKSMEKVIIQNPKNTEALNYIAYTLAEAGIDLKRAEMLALRALEERKKDGFYLDTLGWIYYKQQQYVKAEEVLKEAVFLTNSDLVVRGHYGMTLFQLAKYKVALEIFQRISEEDMSTLSDEEKAIVEHAKDMISVINKK